MANEPKTKLTQGERFYVQSMTLLKVVFAAALVTVAIEVAPTVYDGAKSLIGSSSAQKPAPK